MRTSSLVTVSLPPAMVRTSERLARRHHMTRSELMRTALRHFFEEQAAIEATKIYKAERKAGTLKKLTSLTAPAS